MKTTLQSLDVTCSSCADTTCLKLLFSGVILVWLLHCPVPAAESTATDVSGAFLVVYCCFVWSHVWCFILKLILDTESLYSRWTFESQAAWSLVLSQLSLRERMLFGSRLKISVRFIVLGNVSWICRLFWALSLYRNTVCLDCVYSKCTFAELVEAWGRATLRWD